MTGLLTGPKGGVETPTLRLRYEKPDGSTVVRIVGTRSDGSFSDSYSPDVSGSWSVTASWEGDEDYIGTSATKAFAVTSAAAGGIPFATLGLVGLVAAVALISVVLVLMRRRKAIPVTAVLEKQHEPEPETKPETKPEAPSFKAAPPLVEISAPKARYCIHCGAEMFADALYCPVCASTALGPLSDKTLGMERFDHAAVQSSVIVRHMEVKIGEDATIELQMINAGKKPATLVKIENVVPEGFELVSAPRPYRLEGNDLHLKGKRLDAMKTEEIELLLRPSRRGSFLLKPRIFYLDEDGSYRYHEPDPVTISVKEIGLRGWIIGPE
jgi:hypothetical protein